MAQTKRDLYVEALDVLLRGKIAAVVKSKNWELLAEIARIAEEDAPVDLAFTDPSQFIALRNAITNFHLSGYTHMTEGRVRQIAKMDAEKSRSRVRS